MSDEFYKNIKGFRQFTELSNRAHYVTAPDGWYVVVTDVKNSTDAIARGKYKDINLTGASVIMAILNLAPDTAIPYAFGGDGATLLIPASLVEKTLDALTGIQAKVLALFDLELRAGCVPVAALYESGASLLVAKFYLSPQVSQAVFQGNALSLAESWLKKGGGNVLYGEKTTGEPDLHGLECRWQPIENRHGTMISLLVKAAPAHENDAWRIYADTLRDIEAIYPQHAESCPAYASGMYLSFAPANLVKEAKLHTRTLLSRIVYFIKIALINAIGQLSFVTGRKIAGFDGARYVQELVAHSDARKFDEMLRMVLDSTPQQKQALEQTLEKRRERGEIVYGMHESSQALMTCLVFSLSGNHVHLIDGADGGYALASSQMKQQIGSA